jgi:hypothetical protein
MPRPDLLIMSIHFSPLTTHIGADVEGIDLRE